jgi:glycine/D-amino acid oxidase-like deaminating enzyme
MHVDYIIVGQGLCGTWLSYYLMKEGAQVLVIDKSAPVASASAAASGLINPITGKRLARQWLGDTIFPFAVDAYTEIGDLLQASLISMLPIHTFFSTADEASFFEQKATGTHGELLTFNGRVEGLEHFNDYYGTGTIYPAGLVNLKALINGWREVLSTKDALREEVFNWDQCEPDGHRVRYMDIKASAIIDCSGAAGAGQAYFSRLPFALNKGEAIIASIPGLPRNAIYKYATLSIVPWSDSTFWLGSTFDWDFTDELPTMAFRQKTEHILSQWLRLPYALHEHFAAIRPATVTRDAFVGMHPQYPWLGVLNGMGSKGCSLAPFLADNFAQHLLHDAPLIAQMDVKRYARALNRQDS